MKIYKLNSPFKRIIFTLLFLILIFILILLYVYLNKQYNLVIPCLFHELTNLYCPGCGITRMFYALARFNIPLAFHNNALVMILLPFFSIYYLDTLIAWIRNKKTIFAHKIPNYVWYIIIIIAVIFGILRNIPYFDFLAPIG